MRGAVCQAEGAWADRALRPDATSKQAPSLQDSTTSPTTIRWLSTTSGATTSPTPRTSLVTSSLTSTNCRTTRRRLPMTNPAPTSPSRTTTTLNQIPRQTRRRSSRLVQSDHTSLRRFRRSHSTSPWSTRRLDTIPSPSRSLGTSRNSSSSHQRASRSPSRIQNASRNPTIPVRASRSSSRLRHMTCQTIALSLDSPWHCSRARKRFRQGQALSAVALGGCSRSAHPRRTRSWMPQHVLGCGASHCRDGRTIE